MKAVAVVAVMKLAIYSVAKVDAYDAVEINGVLLEDYSDYCVCCSNSGEIYHYDIRVVNCFGEIPEKSSIGHQQTNRAFVV